MHVITPGLEELKQTYLYILNNGNEVVPYILHHEALIKEINPKMTKNKMLKEHNKTFLTWFKDTIFGDDNAFEMLRKLADEPKRNVRTWRGYNINNYSFYTKSQDDKSIVQNNGVSLKAESQHFATVNNDNPHSVFMSYFGVIEEILELNYVKFIVCVCVCVFCF